MVSSQNQTIIKFNDVFYLRHSKGQYLVTFDNGRYNFPQLGNKKQVKLQITGRDTTDNLKDGDLIDDWQAYKTERYEILQLIKNSETERHGTDEVSNFVVFTGDMHTSMISYLKTDFEGKWNKANMDYSKLAGVEFMTPSLTSPGISEGFHEEIEKLANKVPGASMVGQAVEMLPNLPFFSNDNHEDAGEGSFKHKMLTAELTNRIVSY